ncbi:para-aminobenzoate synthetase / 4-amino-4-deoxychorismate lyase [Candidatus Kryptonium thompsonii]|uniref:Para-aminobenzoate synthetase / 4-amino-4-deoxychorismate lyase n=3 Tax=Candidatus Kryptonium thompsonii TaxID=1633631 RepID=A0A0P1MEP1_9BACT|nr:aminodeoxychorismate synthase component I [Candidatus Kryptonium thompsoni]CUS81649.1 para-aminobenzoate synthetase / 4-amino-4-deoxychorismate lyase [Candidatus Kryptonium thompsoni]CUS82282.1 para-aminobenzoate synthetase / 4-amino-4-deoxychorismate lyase [Candidatus Kryptonium thompsoni]CUS83159.1 para-aminobenzoate synthetase / 4-amino-4-deoxychorismate lyase [Candidatus Kryptonium thompsoni]CUS85887.1 para-aminobenzoate synthetase / 4-amino-4-deoxychorismate lyase [Candidatus Kryptonium
MLYSKLPEKYLNNLAKETNFVLLETIKCDPENFKSFLFVQPVKILTANSIHEIPKLFEDIETYLKKSFYIAGYFAYECGYHFIQKPYLAKALDYPLAWLGVYDKVVVFDHRLMQIENEYFIESHQEINNSNLEITDIKFNIPEEIYFEKIKSIKKYIISGDTYQVNFTGKFIFNFVSKDPSEKGSIISLYKFLREKQKVPYGALIQTDEISILSFAPELFFRIKGDKIITKPMKGTVKRGKTLDEDNKLSEWLRNDEKNRAENLMIVDLLRNDLGKISKIGSVKVNKLFEVEKYQTLFQMTSTIEGELRDNLTYYEIFEAIFPSGSVTGAPKIRTMEIISELELEPRGVYTGAIGYFAPKGAFREAVFNVPIRTIVIRGNHGEMGSGSGIVYDSDPESEYKECQLKAKFLTEPLETFEIIESILWDEEYRLLGKHIKRMSSSAKYFDFQFDLNKLVEMLREFEACLERGRKYKIRVSLNLFGEIKIEKFPVDENQNEKLIITISDVKTNSNDIFLYHKTTKREIYDKLYKKALSEGYADIIFMNEKNQITEGAISNVFIRKGAKLLTPPVECGLLNGVYRQYILETNKDALEEILYLDDLLNADEIFICNAIRGMRKCELHLPM